MYVAALPVLALVASASASLLSRQAGTPSCALTCITQFDFGGFVHTDNECLCTKPVFISNTTTCIMKTSQGQDLQNAISAAQNLCAAVGVTLSSPPAATGTGTGTGSATGTGTRSGSVTSKSSGTTTPASTGTAPPAGTSSKVAALANGVNTLGGLAFVAFFD